MLVEVGARDALHVGDADVLEDVELAVGRRDVVVNHRGMGEMERLVLDRLAAAGDVAERDVAFRGPGAVEELVTEVETAGDGVALDGHDAVAFFTQNKPVKGKAEIQSIYRGARYYFATVDNKKLFDAEPAKYEPQFGGYCAYGVSKGGLYPVELDAFQIVNGRNPELIARALDGEHVGTIVRADTEA